MTADRIVHQGKLAPGPDYRIYLAPRYIEDAAGFEAMKAGSVQLGAIKTFDGFIVDVPPGVDVAKFDTVVIWCETFGKFITAGRCR